MKVLCDCGTLYYMVTAIPFMIHRFNDCTGLSQETDAAWRHRMTTTDPRRITCEECKKRIVESLMKRSWAQLSTVESDALELIAAEVEDESSNQRVQFQAASG